MDNLYRSGDGVTQQLLAARMGLEKSALVRVLRELEKSGEVTGRDDPHDARAKLVYLTEFGRNQGARLLEILLPFEHEMAADLPPDEIMEMLALCGRFMERLHKAEGGTVQPEP